MRKPLFLVRCLAVAIFAWVGCGGGSSSVDPEKYDRTCQNANDCILIVTDACCGCPSAAIHGSAKASYDADFAAAKKNCSGEPCPNLFSCASFAAGCLGGVCVVTQAPTDAGTTDAATD